MPMMRQLRDSTKIIMILVSIAFVGLMVFDWGMELTGSRNQGMSGSAIGSVNGADIPLEEYQRQYQALYNQAQQADPDGRLSPEDLQRIEEAAWTEVVNTTLLQEEARRRGIRVTDSELMEFIRNSPPQEIVDMPAFQTDGQFDLQKYQQALGDPALADTWAEYERQLRQRLPINKLQEQIVAGIPVTDLELRERFREQNERARVAYVYLDPVVLVPPERSRATDEEIRAWYETHKDEFRRDESASIRYATFRPATTAEDTARSRALADSLARVAREDGDFGALARRFSDDRTSADRGGDLGWIAPGSMHPAFASAVSGLQSGQVSDPVLTPFGWHVIRVEARSEENGAPRINARQILIAIEPSTEARQTARQAAQTFARSAAVEGADAFDRAASEAGVEVHESGIYEKGLVVPGLGVAPILSDFVFGNPAGSVSGALEDDGVFHVVRVDARYPAGVVALDQVVGTIRERVVREKRMAAVRAMTPEIGRELRQEGLEGVARRHGLEVETTPWFTRENNIPGIGSGTPVAGAAFGLAPGQTAGPVETERGLYLVRLIEKEGMDENAFLAARAALRDEVRTEKMRAAVSAWFEELKASAEVKDRREELLGRAGAPPAG